jgi:hypothetical protein
VVRRLRPPRGDREGGEEGAAAAHHARVGEEYHVRQPLARRDEAHPRAEAGERGDEGRVLPPRHEPVGGAPLPRVCVDEGDDLEVGGRAGEVAWRAGAVSRGEEEQGTDPGGGDDGRGGHHQRLAT